MLSLTTCVDDAVDNASAVIMFLVYRHFGARDDYFNLCAMECPQLQGNLHDYRFFVLYIV